MKKPEMILVIGAIIGLLMALFNAPLDSLIVSFFSLTLSCFYFCFGFALFNNIALRKIFNADSYKDIGTWEILIAIGTGIAHSILTIGFMFSILSFPMAKTLLAVGIVLSAIIIILALIKNAQDKNRFYRNIILRSFVFVIIAVIFLVLHGHLFETL